MLHISFCQRKCVKTVWFIHLIPRLILIGLARGQSLVAASGAAI